ncbi:pyrroline-5-carboxylate reductase-like [Agrilus planipennis]|uniref:Pyrroline-5-carboxylate reductase n=1 Tax=Agrilus planipennis TaxID=224129 RepID=A0A1W4WUK0_AGRPL|nr:pyrroline-5-carboxylate reductase-like [Agrilus planipennis]
MFVGCGLRLIQSKYLCDLNFNCAITGIRKLCYQAPPTKEKLSHKIGFIGDGNMAKAICNSMVKKGVVQYSQIYVSSPYKKNLHVWETWKTNVSLDNGDVAEKAEIIFIAVKPHMLQEVMDLLITKRKDQIKNKLFVSVLAGVTISSLEKFISNFEKCRVIRVMPNTPMTVGEGCTVYTPGQNVTEDDISNVITILEKAGMCRRVPEYMINAVTALISSGPAFAYLIIEALSDGAVKMGVYRDISTEMAAQTVLGAAKMVLKSQKHVGDLKDDVCSAGGTTIAGIHALEKKGVRGALMDAIEAATKRADELGQKAKDQ